MAANISNMLAEVGGFSINEQQNIAQVKISGSLTAPNNNKAVIQESSLVIDF